MYFALISTAGAATPVFTEGNPEYAGWAIEHHRQIAPENLVLMDIPVLLSPGPLQFIPCEATHVTQADLINEYSEVNTLYNTGSLAEARQIAALWTKKLACLTDKVDTNWLWHAGFITGLLAWEAGDHESAKQAWVWPRSIDPKRYWDDDFTPDPAAERAFGTAFAGRNFPIQSIPSDAPTLVDGQLADGNGNVSAGLHLIQTESPVRTWLVDVRSPILTVHPSTDSKAMDLDEWLALLSSRLPDEPYVFLVRESGSLVEFNLSAHTWEVYDRPPPSPPKWGRWVMGAGAAVVAAGLLDVLLVSRPAAVQAREDTEAGILSFEEGEAAYDKAVDRMIVDYVIMGAGAVMLAIGAPNTVRTWNTEPIPEP